MSSAWPRPVRRRSSSAARMPITAGSAPPPISATCMPGPIAVPPARGAHSAGIAEVVQIVAGALTQWPALAIAADRADDPVEHGRVQMLIPPSRRPRAPGQGRYPRPPTRVQALDVGGVDDPQAELTRLHD